MKYITVFFAPLLFLFSFLMRKNKKLWLFGGWFGMRYEDNSKEFFEYCLQNNTQDIHCIWILKDKGIVQKVEQAGGDWAYAYSLKGIFLQLRAKVFVTCVNSSDFLPFLITPRNYFVQLWHGSPMKHIGLDARKSSFRKMIDKIRFKTIDRYNLLISPAKCFDHIFQKAFDVEGEALFRCGYPRNQKLFVNQETRTAVRESFECMEGEKLIVYLPTHRLEGKGHSPFGFVLSELLKREVELSHKKIKILVKPHFYERHKLTDFKSNENVLIRYDIPFDLYTLLGASDGLITDYSSVAFDYELVGKKIIFYPFDIEDYITNDRPLYFNIEWFYSNFKNSSTVFTLNDLISEVSAPSMQFDLKSGGTIFNMPQANYSEAIYKKILSDLLIGQG